MVETSINSADLLWEQAMGYPEGTKIKTLRRDAQGVPLTVLLKLPPGFEMKDHSHVAAEHQFVVEGEYEARGKHFVAGHYRMIPQHANHGPFRSKSGAIILAVWET